GANATTTTAESDLTNNHATFTTTVTASADVSIEKTGPATADVGTNVTYTLTVRNAGPSAAANVGGTDTRAAGSTFVSAAVGGTLSGNVVTWPTIPSLASGASQTFTLIFTAPTTPGAFNDAAAARSTTPDPNPNNNQTRVSTTGEPSDLVVTKTGPATVVAGATITYTIQVVNHGPAAAASVVVHDTLAAGVTFVSASGGGTLGTGNVVTWPTIASLAPNAPQTFTVTVTAPANAGQLVDGANATTTTPESDLTNNHATFTTTVTASADVEIVKTGPPTPPDVGTNFTYTLTVRNNGPSTATNVVVTDTLP